MENNNYSFKFKNIEEIQDPEFNSKPQHNQNSLSKCRSISKNEIQIEVDKESGGDSPRFVVPDNYDVGLNYSNIDEIPKGIDLQSTIQSQINMKEGKVDEKKHLSNNQVYNNKEEIEYGKKSHLEFLKIMRENKDPLGIKNVGLKPFTKEEVKLHNKENDLWVILHDNVYDLTMYLDYHPGGVKKLMQGAGRDATSLFNKYHPWVNYHTMIGSLQIGYLVDEQNK